MAQQNFMVTYQQKKVSTAGQHKHAPGSEKPIAPSVKLMLVYKPSRRDDAERESGYGDPSLQRYKAATQGP